MCIFIDKMRPRIELKITWSLEELQKLINDENSCVYMKKCQKHVALHPIHLNDLNKAFHDLLGSSINFYDAQFKGLLLAYKNPKLLSQLGAILYDSYFIHVDIEANFYIFRPEKGRVLTGVVNKKADNYIGVLVHKAFNVSIPKVEDEDWEGDNLEVGDDVTFTIVHVDLKGKLPFIRGKLLSSDTSKRRTCDKVSKSSRIVFNSDEEVDNDTNENVLEPANKNKSKKSNRTSFLNTRDSDSSDEELQSVEKVTENKKSSKSSKKAHKSKEKYEEEQNNVRHDVTINNEDDFSSNEREQSTKSSKKSKKSKNSEEKLSKSSKKRLKDEKRQVIEDENAIDDRSPFDQATNYSSATEEVPTSSKTSRKHKRKQLNADESSSSEPVKKIPKHKQVDADQSSSSESAKIIPKHKQVDAEDINVHNSVNNERNNLTNTGDKAETSTPVSVNDNNLKSSEKSSMHNTRIKRELSFSPIEKELYPSTDSEAEISRTLSGWVARPTSPEKSPKSKEKIKMYKNQSCAEEENFSSLGSEVETSKISSGREKCSKSHKKSSKHKEKKIEEQDNLIVEGNNFSPIESEAEASRIFAGREKRSKSPKKSSKHKKKIKVESSEEQTCSNNRGSSLSHIDTEIEDSVNLSQNEDIYKSSKKSSKHKKKIKEEQIDPSIDLYNENQQDQILETSTETAEILKSTKHVVGEQEHSKSRKSNSQDMEQVKVAKTSIQSNKGSLNDKATTSSQNEDETFVKPSKKKKRSSNHEEILPVKIKEEPMSDCESVLNKKSKKKRKNRENADESLLNNENTEIPESDNNSDYRDLQDKETKPVINPTTGKICVKQEFVIKEEGSKKKKNKEDSHPNLKIKRESTSSDVEGTAVKKKSRTFFTE